jgi:hypothetical protein
MHKTKKVVLNLQNRTTLLVKKSIFYCIENTFAL